MGQQAVDAQIGGGMNADREHLGTVRSAIASTWLSSALSTARPSGGSASSSRPFSSAISNRAIPKVARCASPTEVTTPTCGHVRAARSRNLVEAVHGQLQARDLVLRRQLTSHDG